MGDAVTTPAGEHNWRWVIPILPASEAVNGIAHAFDLPPGPLPENYAEPACRISAFIDDLCREEDFLKKCGECIVRVGNESHSGE